MSNLNISIPGKLYKELSKIAFEHNVSIDKLIENALKSYFQAIDKEKFAKSFQKAAKDPETIQIAEEGIKEYFEMLCDFDERGELEQSNENI